jgi:multimeric flavodoxin WrbA
MEADSQTLKVSKYLQSILNTKGSNTDLFNLYDLKLPFYNPDSEGEIWEEIKPILTKSDGFVFATPEWNGSASPMLMNILQYCSYDELAHKPALLVSVSTGRGGANPILEMRQYGYKNNRVLYIPEHLIIRNVESVMNEGEHENEADTFIKKRTDYALEILLAYSKSQKILRETTDFRFSEFENGMS